MNDTREKLIELILGALPHCYSDVLAMQIADYLIANGVTVQKWIPVSERLPKYGRYLCNVKSMAFRGAPYQAILKYENGGFIEDGIYTDFVTHWMPLPEAPKGE